MEEGSKEEEETVDELLSKMAEQPADAALQLKGLKAIQGGSSADPHLAAAAIVAAMQAHPECLRLCRPTRPASVQALSMRVIS